MMLLRLFFVCILKFVLMKEVITANLECYSTYDKGASYNGTVARTQTGKQCLTWGTVTNNSLHYFENHNYCRNPFNLSKPWCYTEKTNLVYEYCNISMCGCRHSIYDRNYRGHIGITRNGIACSIWNRYKSLSTSNDGFCRTPEGDSEPTPWCYTKDPAFRWDRCNVPVCNGMVCPDLSEYHLEALDGKARYQFGESVIAHCKDGYTMTSGRIYLTCLNSGNWNDTLPRCEEDCRKSEMDLTYTGYKNITIHGYNCVKWNNRMNIRDGNYCRTPQRDSLTTPWCYTGRKDNFYFDLCSIPICNGRVCPDLSNHHLEALDRKARYQYGESIIVHCKDGYTMTSGRIYLTCLNSGYWNDTLPRCEVITCQPIKIPTYENVEIKPIRISYVVNSRVTLSCNYGYSGEDVHSLCKTNGKWSTEQLPICKLITCQPIKIPTSGNIEVKPIRITYLLNSNLTISCKYGYNGVDVHSRCKANGKWSTEQLPICKLITCQPKKIPTSGNVEIKPIRISYVVDSIVTLSCKTGYSGVDEQSVCKANEKWSSEQLPICIPVPCPALNKTEHMVIPTNISGYHYGDNVTFKCVNGYNLSGPSLIICRSSTNRSRGEWSDEQPTCEALPCRSPDLPKHAINKEKEKESSTYYVDQDVYFKCEQGYKLIGNGSFKCIAKGNPTDVDWNYDGQKCEGVICPMPNETDHLVLLSNLTEYRFGDTTTFDCVGDFELSSQLDATRHCVVDDTNLEGGKWTGEIPFCQAKASAQHSGAFGPAIGGGIGSAVIVLVVVVVIVFIIRRRTAPQKKKGETRYKESTLELDNSNIYSQVEERETKSYIEKPVVKNQTKNVYYNEVKDDNETGGYYAFSVGSQLPNDAIEVKNFHEYVEKRRGKEGNILKEFLKLKGGLQKPTDAALKPGNRLKNKYKDMYAYDETRVILDNSSYINASFIQGYGQVRKYIASQGPLDKTVDDFWSMVWQYDCGKIVMLTNVFENGKEKCIQYWPDHEQQKTSYGSISLLLVKEDVYSDFTVRRITLQKEKDTKTVLQFHFTAWPDKDVPKYASSLVHFRHKVNTTRTVGKGPMVVHCSAGVGRTGTYIALDYIVNEAKERDYVEVFRSVEILRNQRVNMVQTANQYLFLHEAVLEALMCPNSGIPCRDFPDNYKNLMRFDNNKKKHKLQIEFELLNSISSRHDEEVFSKGKSEENRGKNRYSNIIPVGSEMPLLSTAVDGHNEYINAVFLPGYRNNKTFIVTQMPLETTVVDMWRLVHDYEVPTIVMLNKDIQKGKSSNVYWPEGNKDVTFGPFNITRTHISTQNLYTCLDLTYKYKNQESKQVKLFQSKFWEENMINPVSANDMLSFLSATEDEQSNNRGCGPVLVHCLNGCDKSGLYCVLATVIERLRIEQDVDIQHIIKQMRNRRPQIIPNYEQFQFIYEAVIEYLKEFETYSNFQ